MAWPIDPSRYAPDAPLTTDLWSDLIGEIGSLLPAGVAPPDVGGSPVIANSSFENDPVNTNQPSGWVLSSGTAGIVTQTNQHHGVQSYMVTQNTNGSGAGYLQNTNYINVSPNMSYRLQWEFAASQPNVYHQAQVLWYDHNTNPVGNTNVFVQSNGFTTGWTEYGFQITPPAPAVAAKLQFTLGNTNFPPTGQPANLFLDNISTAFRPPYSNVVAFTNTNSWTVLPGTFRILVKAVGGGGASGGFPSYSGGGGGGYCEGFFDVVPGQTITFTVGGVGQATTIPILGMTAQGGNGTSGGQASGGAVQITGQNGSVYTVIAAGNDSSYYPGRSPGVSALGPVGSADTGGMVLIYY